MIAVGCIDVQLTPYPNTTCNPGHCTSCPGRRSGADGQPLFQGWVALLLDAGEFGRMRIKAARVTALLGHGCDGRTGGGGGVVSGKSVWVVVAGVVPTGVWAGSGLAGHSIFQSRHEPERGHG